MDSPDAGLADAAGRSAAAATLLVSHPSICQSQQLICSLLQVSRGMRDAISQHAPRGLLPVRLHVQLSHRHHRQHLTAAQAEAAERAALQLASWLRDHSSLVGSISLSLPRSVMDAVQDGITAALQHAAASPPGLLLRSFTANIDSTTLLQCLPSAHPLTQLEFSYSGHDTTAQVAGILAGLTGLCSMRIAGNDFMVNHGPLLPVLANHTRLTSLELGHVWGEAEYGENLPASLQKLHVNHRPYGDVPMHLAHATALSDLSLWVYVDGDDLPPNVQLLKLQQGCGRSLGPFVALQHLRELHLGEAEYLPQADLVQLRDLTALSRLTLVYTRPLADYESLNQAAQAWRQLIFLRELHIGGLSAPASTLQAIGSLAQSLESLTLGCGGPGTYLAVDTLRMLTSLTCLSLRYFSDQHLAALPDMPQLKDLELEDADVEVEFLVDRAVVFARAQRRCAKLAMATQLTKLVWVREGLDDYLLGLYSLTGLRHLDISQSWYSDAMLPVIAEKMPHLKQLDVARQISAEDREVLAAARPELLLTCFGA